MWPHWLGAISDHLDADKPELRLPMGISLAGSSIAQNGSGTASYAIGADGSSGLLVKEADSGLSASQRALNRALLASTENMLTRHYDDPFMATYTGLAKHAQAWHEAFRAATAGVQPGAHVGSSDLSRQLAMVARSIAAADALGSPQQTFYVEYLGWDHHDELLDNHARMLGVLDRALHDFQTSLELLGVADKTVTFTGSDFGRTLGSNGNGTDHGWGGNILVMGRAVNGGRVFGEYPEIALGTALDAGGGVLIPSTPTDAVFADLARWFGVTEKSLPALFPHLDNFGADVRPGLVG